MTIYFKLLSLHYLKYRFKSALSCIVSTRGPTLGPEQSDILCNMETKPFLEGKKAPEKVNNGTYFKIKAKFCSKPLDQILPLDCSSSM